MRTIRRERPAETLELVSDVRERLVCRLLGAPRNLTPAWEPGHVFRRHNRIGQFGPSALATVPRAVGNLYAAYNLALKSLLGRGGTAFDTVRSARPLREPAALGIHPFASAPCKLWPVEKWIELMRTLRLQRPDLRLVLFGAPHERSRLEQLNAAIGGAADLVTASLAEFKQRLRKVDLLIGLDSFSVHLAHSVGVRAVVLVGPNDPVLFTPPSAHAVSRRSSCPHQPCDGRPRCVGTSFEYACMREIDVVDVLAGLAELTAAPPIGRPLSLPPVAADVAGDGILAAASMSRPE